MPLERLTFVAPGKRSGTEFSLSTALVIFSDLDGTLLDHHNYQFDEAKPALARARAANVPVILATSKTAAEVHDLISALGLDDAPAIVENGGGFRAPSLGREHFQSLLNAQGPKLQQILSLLDGIDDKLRKDFVGFSTMCVEDVMHHTGLNRSQAEKAKVRQYSEPGLWIGSDENFSQFCNAAIQAGLHVVRGGRFVHVMGQTNKAKQMARLKATYEALWPDKDIVTAALGDAPNDTEMIEAADFGFIIANPDGKGIAELSGERTGHILRVKKPGPAGWNEAVTGLLDRLEL